MDIKGIARNLIPFAPRSVDKGQEAKTESKLDANAEKEGNGQAAGEEQKRKPLSPEELADAVKHLEGLQGVKDNGLTVRADTRDGITVVYVEDRDGKVVRRIPEADLRALTANREKKSGNLLNRAL